MKLRFSHLIAISMLIVATNYSFGMYEEICKLKFEKKLVGLIRTIEACNTFREKEWTNVIVKHGISDSAHYEAATERKGNYLHTCIGLAHTIERSSGDQYYGDDYGVDENADECQRAVAKFAKLVERHPHYDINRLDAQTTCFVKCYNQLWLKCSTKSLKHTK